MEHSRAEKIIAILAESLPGMALEIVGKDNNCRIKAHAQVDDNLKALMATLLRIAARRGYNINHEDVVLSVPSQELAELIQRVKEEV